MWLLVLVVLMISLWKSRSEVAIADLKGAERRDRVVFM